MIYDLHIKASISELNHFMEYFSPLLKKIDHIPQRTLLFDPIYILLLSEEDPFHDHHPHMMIKKDYYIYEYVYKPEIGSLRVSLFMEPRIHEENDIFESWLTHMSRQFPQLHIHLYYYHIYEKSIYDDDVFYLYLHNNHILETYDIPMDDYYLKKHGKEILNGGFYILYPIYKELIQDDPYYYKNYESRFYKILVDPRLMYASPSYQNQLFEHMIAPKYRRFRPLFYQFLDFLKTHCAIRDMVIDETTRMIGKYRESPLVRFQCKVRHKLRMREILEELKEYALLPPYTKEAFEREFSNHYLPIYRMGGGQYREIMRRNSGIFCGFA